MKEISQIETSQSAWWIFKTRIQKQRWFHVCQLSESSYSLPYSTLCCECLPQTTYHSLENFWLVNHTQPSPVRLPEHSPGTRIIKESKAYNIITTVINPISSLKPSPSQQSRRPKDYFKQLIKYLESTEDFDPSIKCRHPECIAATVTYAIYSFYLETLLSWVRVTMCTGAWVRYVAGQVVITTDVNLVTKEGS